MKRIYFLLAFLLVYIFSCKKEDEFNVKADFTYQPDVVYVGDTVLFDASDSHNSKGNTNGLRYAWDFENDGVLEYEYSPSPSAKHVFEEKGTYTSKLQLEYEGGGYSIKEKIIEVKIHTEYFTAQVDTHSFVANNYNVDLSGSNTIIKGLRTSDSSYIEIEYLGQYNTGTFSVMNGGYYNGDTLMSINQGEITFNTFDSVSNIIQGNFELDIDAVSGSTLYISQGKFYLNADD